MVTRRVLGRIAQLRFERAAMIASPSTDIALAGVDPEFRDIEQSHPMALLFQMVLDPQRKLGGFRDVRGVLTVPVARRQQ